MEAWEKKSRNLRKESRIFRDLKKIFFIVIDLQGKFVKTEFHEPEKFITKNRKDIELNVKFLGDVLERQIRIEDTEIFKKRCLDEKSPEIHKLHMEHFLELYEEIRENGMKKPIIVARYNSPIIKIWHWSDGEKIWTDFKNETGFQVVEGTHRLPIAIYLNIEKIPVKIYKPIFTQIPNFTKMLKID